MGKSLTIASNKTAIILMAVFALLLGIATFVEQFYGTQAAKVFFYYSPLMFLLQFLLVVSFLAITFRYRLFRKKKTAFLLIHFAFIIILIGAFTTHFFSEEGSIHLRENEQTNSMLVQTNLGRHTHVLPFNIKLEKFILTRYPGSTSPAGFESIVEITDQQGNTHTQNISMNKPLDIQGYRIFQASYDTDEKGSILSVNKDVAGRTITYIGYFFLLMGLLLSFVVPDGRFQYLLAQLKNLKSAKLLLVLLLLSASPWLPVKSQPAKMLYESHSHRVSAEHASKFGALAVQTADGRIKPMNTFSSDILRKIHHKQHIGKLNADQFLLSLLVFPDMWKQSPFIYYNNKEIAQQYQLTEYYCSFTELFDADGTYKLQKQVEQSHAKAPAERNRYDKAIIQLDERANIFYQIMHHQLLRIFPLKDADDGKWYAMGDDLSAFSATDADYIINLMSQYIGSVQTSIQTNNTSNADRLLDVVKNYQQANSATSALNDKKIRAEVLFNQLNIFQHSKKSYLIIGGLLLIVLLIAFFTTLKYEQLIVGVLVSVIALTAVFHLFGIILRGYIGAYAPWSNAYETMIYVAWISVLGGFIFIKQSKITFALATLFGGLILFVAGLNRMDPQIGMLVPVLKSPWLMIHVAVIVAAYSFFGIACLLGITNLVLMAVKRHDLSQRIKELTIINEMSLLIGLALMTAGTFLGAVWANESWGRYWGWDAKETWALITILVYSIVVHLRLIKRWDNPRLLNWMSIVAFLSVLMTYFGVNYFLSGLHAYA